MEIEFDAIKRDTTLIERGLDFQRAAEIFAGRHYTAPDLREGYDEPRYITMGRLAGRMVIVVWTPRGKARRIISMRKANEREQERYAHRVG
ncbi:BrnT family toxin [Pararobbsia silviterrae]|uniref:BrnT family toxin n=1 Tax=Pararobbsia silviterrae TaxID=1792498 RepID=A0A494Y8F6_9BURK|nr:BrnT family toxin [Pararobbsia silviterrae]RKP58405.1 BrnT family toxin [Pararobbsia silviterrae]